MIKWWNILYTPSIPTKEQLDRLIIDIDLTKIPNTHKCAHEVYLTVSAQIYGINIGQNMTTICQSDSIVTFYRCSYQDLLQEDSADSQNKLLVNEPSQAHHPNQQHSQWTPEYMPGHTP